jgi:hypothetical protein
MQQYFTCINNYKYSGLETYKDAKPEIVVRSNGRNTPSSEAFI